MPRPANPTPSISRTYKVPSELGIWLDSTYKIYRLRSGKYAKSKIDVVCDALEVLKESARDHAIPVNQFAKTPEHARRPPGAQLALLSYKLPVPLVEWLEEYHRFHRMRDGTRAATYTDVVIDALERARERSVGASHGVKGTVHKRKR